MAVVKQEEICQMFNRIASTYDTVNRVLSWGLDRSWRDVVVASLPDNSNLRILDLATGTADLALALSKARPEDHIWGVDPAQEMLFLAQKKIGALTNITLQAGDACDLKFENNFFDIITIAFGIRNILDTNKALGEIKRVLKPGGRLCVLEFSLPTNFFIKLGYLAYFRHILPKLGGLISGDRRAYEYLNKTVEAFYTPQKFSQILKSAGFTINKITSLSAGIATLYEAGNA